MKYDLKLSFALEEVFIMIWMKSLVNCLVICSSSLLLFAQYYYWHLHCLDAILRLIIKKVHRTNLWTTSKIKIVVNYLVSIVEKWKVELSVDVRYLIQNNVTLCAVPIMRIWFARDSLFFKANVYAHYWQ